MAESPKPSQIEDTKPDSTIQQPPARRKPPKLRKKQATAEETNKQQSGNPDTAGSPSPDIPQTSPPNEAREPESMDANQGDTESVDAQSSGPEMQPEPQAAPAPKRETMEEDQPAQNLPRRRRRRRGQQEMVPLGNVGDVGNTVNEAGELVQAVGSKAVNTVTDTAGKVVGGALSGGQSEDKKGKDEQLRLRLDLNLDIEVQLKAKIHGDLTLQLL
ncbi:hypothetical protein BDV36DRAFT_280049 [Aspergillus pseudocaelatus]|uniref:Uncharacterized protein n=1 Tax=Aspergillus pseudocaelatus TaxID=1825620 RepID=A0ABQ6X2H6_9EURO|nr:hypothetical protein BDV36DRAFT_280049 [Aspergillus pseudocaelatus]